MFFLFSYICYRFVFHSSLRKRPEELAPPPEVKEEKDRAAMQTLVDELRGIPHELVSVTAFDKTPLYALYYHVKDGAPLQILFHGYRGIPQRDLCGGAKLAREAGHNALLVYQRAHGKSGGTTTTFGVKERRDCLTWVEYAVKRFGENVEICLVGVSLGATTVVMAAELGLPKQVKAIIADSPFTTPDEIIHKVVKDMKVPSWLAMPALRTAARLYGGFSTRAADTRKAIKKAEAPVLLIHGKADGFVPCAMSEEIYGGRESADVTLFTVDGADHAISYLVDPKGYTAAVQEFFQKIHENREAI